jgi:putative aminopeptidase FrvX
VLHQQYVPIKAMLAHHFCRRLALPARRCSTRAAAAAAQPWSTPMPAAQFQDMRAILAAPSPVGLEAAMTEGVLAKAWQRHVDELGWKVHRFKGNASVVLDTHPDAGDDMLKVMFVGHADKIRMQVRDIAPDGKVYVDTDSFLPLTLLGNPVNIFSKGSGDDDCDDRYTVLKGGTVEALGAIHFAEPAHRSGSRGVKPEDIYVELQLHGEQRKKQLEKMGVRCGDSVLLDRKIQKGFAPDTFSGAYLDNGLGCFVASEVASLVSGREQGPLENVRCLFAIASHEEIGRFGSRVVAGAFSPDILVAVDVNHDYKAAPNMGSKRFPKLSMGDGFTITQGSVTSPAVNDMLEAVAKDQEIPCQMDVRGRDTGTDGMAGFLASVDAASASVGFPVRNMHTISECGHTGDVLGCVHALHGLVERLESDGGFQANDLKEMHPRLDLADPKEWEQDDIDAAKELGKPHEDFEKRLEALEKTKNEKF